MANRLKMMVLYILIHPIEELKDYIKTIPKSLKEPMILYKPKIWIGPLWLIFIIKLLNKDYTSIILVIILIMAVSFLRLEQTGTYKHWYRQRIKTIAKNNILQSNEEHPQT